MTKRLFKLIQTVTLGSLWLAGISKIYHYSRTGEELGEVSGVSSDQKFIAVVQASAERH